MNPKISIITVCYNSAATIEKTLISVLNQSYKNFEYIIIDGKSIDKTIDIIKSYESNFLKQGILLRIISEPDNGIYDAMNKGIKNSSGEIIGIINSDDWYEENALQIVVDAYNQSEFDLFYADIRIIKPNGKTFIKHSKLSKFVTTRHWNHPTSFVRKRVYDEIGLFSLHSLYDDFDLFLRIKKANKKIVVKNIVIANFVFGGASNKKGFKYAMERCKMRYWCYRNNGFSRLYWFECFIMEIVKTLLA